MKEVKMKELQKVVNQSIDRIDRKVIIDFLTPALQGKDIDQTEKELAIQQALAMGLNPAKREVYFIPFPSKKTNKYSIAIVTSYEVYCKRAAQYLDGMEIKFEGDKRIIITGEVIEANENPKFISIKVWKKGSKKPFTNTFTRKQLQGGKNSSDWVDDPRTMMMKTAIVRMFRIVFPEINLPYSQEEIIVGENIEDVNECQDVEKIKNVNNVEEISETTDEDPYKKFNEVLSEYSKVVKRDKEKIVNAIVEKSGKQIQEMTKEELDEIISKMLRSIKTETIKKE